ncbi:microviridin/marinostatin family tricyclic proteinase inhibitor [Hyalangium versicolor]|uniref:microviridin/marinostatin family tricyclic proteinase inhibitor n=1 Tax=Hyalangium versicolor TaxID=2861190 RepID=UPI001CCDC2B0|nr:microviridin/marinostatin family tricyclic proteinase inhibitor [Hyalangium versicolor]
MEKQKNETQQKPQAKKPFFARLLETQELESVAGGYAEPIDSTNKSPSDKEDHSLPSDL